MEKASGEKSEQSRIARMADQTSKSVLDKVLGLQTMLTKEVRNSEQKILGK
jgi:hypothetical protein